jgi:predicted membrane GTPase involved in stress response
VGNEIRNHGVRISPSTGKPATESVAGIFDRGQLVIGPLLDDPMLDYDCNPPLWQV